MELGNFLRDQFDILQMFLGPNVRRLMNDHANNPIGFAINHPALNAEFMRLANAAFPGNLNQLFDRFGADTLMERHGLLTALIQRYLSLGLPPRYRFGSYAIYVVWLDEHPIRAALPG